MDSPSICMIRISTAFIIIYLRQYHLCIMACVYLLKDVRHFDNKEVMNELLMLVNKLLEWTMKMMSV